MAVGTESRVYANSAIEKGSEYYDYGQYVIEYGDIENYSISSYLGKGKYSQVFLGLEKKGGKRCVIKVLKPVREKKVQREIMILKKLIGAEHIVQLLDVVKEAEGTRALIFGYEPHLETREVFKTLTLPDVKYYSRKLLEALDFCHSIGIFHRDIKPHNIIINHPARTLKIIDWGLAEFYIPQTAYNIGVGSMHFKCPELLLNYKTYDYSIDIWAFGCVLCEMVLGKYPIFNGGTNETQLLKVATILGSGGLLQYIRKYKIHIQSYMLRKIKEIQKESVLNSPQMDNRGLLQQPKEKEGFFELISALLEYDHQKRATAKEALNFAFVKEGLM